jgi:hypothetical protein
MRRADKIMIAFGLVALAWAWSGEIVALVCR